MSDGVCLYELNLQIYLRSVVVKRCFFLTRFRDVCLVVLWFWLCVSLMWKLCRSIPSRDIRDFRLSQRYFWWFLYLGMLALSISKLLPTFRLIVPPSSGFSFPWMLPQKVGNCSFSDQNNPTADLKSRYRNSYIHLPLNRAHWPPR